jgi:uncharacterized membrane protein SirB2
MNSGSAKAFDLVAGVLLVAGVVAFAVFRFTPFSWFPWDMVAAAVLFLAGCGLGLMAKRMRAQAQESRS